MGVVECGYRTFVKISIVFDGCEQQWRVASCKRGVPHIHDRDRITDLKESQDLVEKNEFMHD